MTWHESRGKSYCQEVRHGGSRRRGSESRKCCKWEAWWNQTRTNVIFSILWVIFQNSLRAVRFFDSFFTKIDPLTLTSSLNNGKKNSPRCIQQWDFNKKIKNSFYGLIYDSNGRFKHPCNEYQDFIPQISTHFEKITYKVMKSLSQNLQSSII